MLAMVARSELLSEEEFRLELNEFTFICSEKAETFQEACFFSLNWIHSFWFH